MLFVHLQLHSCLNFSVTVVWCLAFCSQSCDIFSAGTLPDRAGSQLSLELVAGCERTSLIKDVFCKCLNK